MRNSLLPVSESPMQTFGARTPSWRQISYPPSSRRLRASCGHVSVTSAAASGVEPRSAEAWVSVYTFPHMGLTLPLLWQ
jgi:hypothetical protein